MREKNADGSAPPSRAPQGKEDHLTTDEWLRRRAAVLRAKAEKLKTEAADLTKEADRLEETAKEILAARRGASRVSEHLAAFGKHPHLRVREHRRRVEANMEMAELGAAISKGKARAAKEAGVETDALVQAAQAKGLSLRRLAQEAAEAVGRHVPPSGLSQARRGARPIAPDVAEFIAERLRSDGRDGAPGFEATAKNWPGGIA